MQQELNVRPRLHTKSVMKETYCLVVRNLADFTLPE
jgi:hypothetical protein